MARAKRWPGSWQVQTTAAISRARARLGPESPKALFAQVARPLATESTPGACHRRWRVTAIDGTVFGVPDSQENAAYFGRPRTHRTERCAFPQVRVVALAECGTHAITAAAPGPRTVSEPVPAREVSGALGEGHLLPADRGFTGLELWRAAAAGGADLLWRVRVHQVLPVREELPDGSCLSEIVTVKDHRKRADPQVVRVIEYTLDDPGRPGAQAPCRLLTTILDHTAAPATEPAAGLRASTARLLPPRRRRSNPRVVTRKMSNFGVKRDEHRIRSQPTRAPPRRRRDHRPALAHRPDHPTNQDPTKPASSHW